MSALESSIRALLRPSDLVLELAVPPPNNAGTPDPSPGSPSRSQIDDTRSKRILAAVAHSDGPNTQEEGSVFILKWKAAGRAFDQSDILRVFPVFGGFSITMAQVRRETWPMAESSPGLLSLTITQGDIQDLEPLTLATARPDPARRVGGVQAAERNCRRVASASDHESTRERSPDAPPASAPPLTTFSWLAPYTSKRVPLPALFGVPQDLRVAHKPLHTRLSAAFAGEAGDDFTDIVRIRDEWIRSRVRETSSKGKQNLRVRIGTFNVNGNLLSQDLSPWVGGNGNGNTTDPFIPPPFSIGEVAKNPFDTPAPAPISDESEPKVEAAPAPSRVVLGEKDSVETDADHGLDMLVLGFQELDLSTEALIYSTSTLKEEAWCTAAFAALGAHAELRVYSGVDEQLASKQLVGMLIVVIVRKALKPCFSEIKTSAAGTGIMGLMGNKGGTAIHMKFTPPATDAVKNPGPTVLTFVNAHLAAFDEMVEKRNADFHDLAKCLRFDPACRRARLHPFPTDDGAHVVDLNYRLDVPDADVRTILAAEEWAESRYETLLQYDQLKSAVRTNKAFDMFSESPIVHLPTYRCNAGLLKDDLGYDLKSVIISSSPPDRSTHAQPTDGVLHGPTVCSSPQTSSRQYGS
ncbi:Endonuclease/exonuclease/phosphatase [Mycena olivaceomarginata]|nr:Endonuclease/exonuclease/phosphatase [Mycena olivaceomarginata]